MSVFQSSKIVSAILKADHLNYQEQPIYNNGNLIAVVYTVPSPLVQSTLLAIAPHIHYISAADSDILSFSI